MARSPAEDVGFRVHSVEVAPEPDSFVLFVPEDEDQFSPWDLSGVTGPEVEAEILGASVADDILSSGYSFRYLTATEMTTGVSDDVVLRGVGSPDRVMRMDKEARAQLFADESRILDTGKLTGRARLLGLKWRFVPDADQEPWTSDVWIPVAYVHRPAYRSCKTTYVLTQTDTDTAEAHFAIGGSGGSGEVKFTVEFTRTLLATAACKQALVRAKVSVVWGTTYVQDQPINYGARLTISDVNQSDQKYADLKGVRDLCGIAPGMFAGNAGWHRLSEATGGVADAELIKYRIEQQVAGTLKVGLEFAKVPLDVSVSYTRTSAQSTTLETQLMPGADYCRYHPRANNPMEICWTLENARPMPGAGARKT